MSDLLVVKAKLKDAVASDTRVAGDLAAGLDKKVREILKAAEARAKGNNRKTVMQQDL